MLNMSFDSLLVCRMGVKVKVYGSLSTGPKGLEDFRLSSEIFSSLITLSFCLGDIVFVLKIIQHILLPGIVKRQVWVFMIHSSPEVCFNLKLNQFPNLRVRFLHLPRKFSS